MSAHETPAAQSEPSTPDAQAASAVDLVQRAVALLAITPKRMTSKQRRHGLKFRKGVEPSIRVVANLSDEHGVVVPGMTSNAMRASLERAASLRTVRLALVGALRVIDDEIFAEEGGAYGNALTLYGMLKKVAHRHKQIRDNLAPVTEFFSYRSQRVREENVKKNAAEKERAGSDGTLRS